MKALINFFESRFPYISFFIFSFLIYLLLRQNSTILSLKEEFTSNLNYFKNQQTNEREELKKQLSLLREELIRYKSQQEGRDQILALTLNKNQPENKNVLSAEDNLNNLLKQSDQLTATIAAKAKVDGIVKLKKSWSRVEVYEDKKASSRILGYLVANKLYFIYERSPNWYKIEYDEGKWGWVQASLVEEL
jgi:hypothetical protein